MFKNLRQFDRSLRDFSRRHLPEQTQKAIRKFAFELFRSVVYDTPVDTGRARGNWHLTINQIPGEVFTEPPYKDRVPEAPDRLTPFRLGDIIYLTNNLPYIIRLEHGHSQQAPEGMLERNMERLSDVFGQ